MILVNDPCASTSFVSPPQKQKQALFNTWMIRANMHSRQPRKLVQFQKHASLPRINVQILNKFRTIRGRQRDFLFLSFMSRIVSARANRWVFLDFSSTIIFDCFITQLCSTIMSAFSNYFDWLMLIQFNFVIKENDFLNMVFIKCWNSFFPFVSMRFLHSGFSMIIKKERICKVSSINLSLFE